MIHVALHEPEIPPNTGNVARSCAATGVPLHLIGRLGFRLDDRALRRAGLDYWPAVDVRRHDTLAAFEQALAPARLFCLSAHAQQRYTRARFAPGDCLLFGSETRGLPQSILNEEPSSNLGFPMREEVRSLNLASTATAAIYEAVRQFGGLP